MGRCHGGFCLPKIVEILKEEYGVAPRDIKLKNLGSRLFIGETKDLRGNEESGRISVSKC